VVEEVRAMGDMAKEWEGGMVRGKERNGPRDEGWVLKEREV
jgi:hypothetical protein